MSRDLSLYTKIQLQIGRAARLDEGKTPWWRMTSMIGSRLSAGRDGEAVCRRKASVRLDRGNASIPHVTCDLSLRAGGPVVDKGMGGEL